MEDSGGAPTAADVLLAARRIRRHLRRTPLELSPALSTSVGRSVHMKMENLQRTGSFKVRGALNALASLNPDERERGVVTASAGNHGLGVALAARVLGIPSTVYLPADAPRTKRDRIGRLGATVRLIDGGYDAAHGEAERSAAATGASYVHAFSDPAVVAGQGTVALEILSAIPTLGTLVVPVGGGGLIGGMGVVARALNPALRVIGVQSRATRSMHDSWRAGELRPLELLPTLCDGLAGETDARSLARARVVVDEMLLVEEDEVRSAIQALWKEEGIAVEGSGAVGVSAIRSGRLSPGRGPVAVVITGGNIDPARLSEIVAEESE